MIRQPWDIQRDTLALGKTPLRSAAQVERHGLVHAIDSLRVPVNTRPAQPVAEFPETATRCLVHLKSQPDPIPTPFRAVSADRGSLRFQT